MNDFRLFMSQKEIAEASGLAPSYISMILKGDRQPTLETAEKLMNATGVCREAWIWPEDHYNPYMAFIDGSECLSCHRRFRTIRHFSERAQKYLLKYPTLDAMQQISDETHTFSNNTKRGFMTIWSYINKDGKFKRLVSSGMRERKVPFDWEDADADKQWPWSIKQLGMGEDLITPNLHDHLRSEKAWTDLDTAIRTNVTACMVIMEKKRLFAGIAFDGLPYGNPVEELINVTKGFLASKAMDKLISNVDKIL